MLNNPVSRLIFIVFSPVIVLVLGILYVLAALFIYLPYWIWTGKELD